MVFKSLLLSVTFLTALGHSEARAGWLDGRNICDDLMEKSKMSEDDPAVKKCLADNGYSRHYKERKEAERVAKEKTDKETSEAAAVKGSIETKEFSEFDIQQGLGYGEFPVFAVEYSFKKYSSDVKQKTLTATNDLCRQLGYTKAIKSSISGEILPADASAHGFILSGSKKRELYEDKKSEHTVSKYTSITCVRVNPSLEISRDRSDRRIAEQANDAIEAMNETAFTVDTTLNPSTHHDSNRVDNSSRKPGNQKESSTPSTGNFHFNAGEDPYATLPK